MINYQNQQPSHVSQPPSIASQGGSEIINVTRYLKEIEELNTELTFIRTQFSK
jgi:hypothetical protein